MNVMLSNAQVQRRFCKQVGKPVDVCWLQLIEEETVCLLVARKLEGLLSGWEGVGVKCPL